MRLSRARVTQQDDGFAGARKVQLASIENVAGLMLGAAARSKSARRLILGKWASAIRRRRRRSARSSTSAESTSAR